MYVSRLVLALWLVSGLAIQANAQDTPPVGQRVIDLMWECQGRGQNYDLAVKTNMPDPEFFGSYDTLICASYISGFVDLNAIHEGMLGAGMFCFPKTGLSQEQQMRMFVKWAEEHPEDLHQSRRLGVLLTFTEAFPCK